MGADKDIIVAIELGSSAIRGIAGKKEADGSMQILAIEQERISGIIRRGVIYNIDKTKTAIERIKEKLNERLGVNITRVYAGIAGQSVHTENNRVKRTMDTRIKVSQELVDSLMDENRNAQYPDREILEVIPQEYNMGINNEIDPVGTQTDQIEGRYMNVIARTQLQENIRRCMREAGLDVVELFTTPLALADSLLPDTEKRSGCALVDLGAETTTVAIYTKNILRHLVTIPLGGNNITNDIASLKKVEFDEAEKLKKKYGVALIEKKNSDEYKSISISNDRKIDELELKQIVSARMEEIIANIWNQIEKGKWQEELLSGITLTGGGAALEGLSEAIAHPKNFSTNRIKIAKELILNTPTSSDIKTSDIEGLNSAIALLLHGNESCAVDIPTEEEEVESPAVETEVIIEEPSTVEIAEESAAEPAEKPEENIQEENKPEKNKKNGLFSILKKLVSEDE